MPSPVYSTILFMQQGLHGDANAHTGFEEVFVVRDIAVFAPTLSGEVFGSLIGPAHQTMFYFSSEGSLTERFAAQYWHWQGRLVLPPGSEYVVHSPAQPTDWTICGYSLAKPIA